MSIGSALEDLIYEKEGCLEKAIRDKVERFGSRLKEAYREERVCASTAYYDADYKVAGHEAFVPGLATNSPGMEFLEAVGTADALSIRVLPADTYPDQEDTLLDVDLQIYVGK